MDNELVDEIIACLPQDRTLLHYYRDRYAVYLLARVIQHANLSRIADIKRTPFGKFLEKSVVNAVLGKWGSENLSKQMLSQCWPLDIDSTVETYRLSLGTWGNKYACNDNWQQTSRRGANLVLHLNFSGQHDTEFSRQTGVNQRQSFNFASHPTSDKYNNTLAWARLDVDFDSDSVLIEEIQTDWLRRVICATNWIIQTKRFGRTVWVYDLACNSNGLVDYQRKVLSRHEKIWAEAMLFSTIWFIQQELGIKHIYYHTAKTGAILKGVSFGSPPRSLYSDLPKRFCFEKTDEVPAMLLHCAKARRRIKKVKRPTWYKMAV